MDINGMMEHMKKHANIMRPKFELLLDLFEKEFAGLGVGTGVTVGVGLGLGVGTGVMVGVGLGLGVGTGVTVGVGLGLGVGVSVGVSVGVGLGLGVSVGVGTSVGVRLGFGIGVMVGTVVGIGVLPALTLLPSVNCLCFGHRTTIIATMTSIAANPPIQAASFIFLFFFQSTSFSSSRANSATL